METSSRHTAGRNPIEDRVARTAAEPSLETLLQENASLKQLVVSLSEMVIRRAADQR